MLLQKTLNSKTQVLVPNDILLLVFDILINEAVESQEPITWLLLYSDVETWTGRLSLGVASEEDALHNQMEYKHRNKVLRQRFRATGLLRQVSKATCHLIQRKFRPAIAFYHLDNKPVTALVIPEIDLFATTHQPYAWNTFNSLELEVAADNKRLIWTLHSPGSGAQTVLDYIQHYHVPLLDCTDPVRRDRLAITLKMPSLKEVWIECGWIWRRRYRRKTRHAGIRPISSGVFSHLHKLQPVYRRAYFIFRELQKRGVKLYCVGNWHKKDKVIQIFVTKNDTQMQWVKPNCPDCLKTGSSCNTDPHSDTDSDADLGPDWDSDWDIYYESSVVNDLDWDVQDLFYP
ncbi:hypothetical protein CCHR01_18434 [Colletotrichum chrysophilum]|uniref:Uncharacterized protein n=1 Tax=Colletotrichum chrysophilum TaxID=1836956 RepID=A0AAD9E8N5_9PEZI|nr:hypothetical protein CCHR01_18434 [Colletotrichum chrysophilum]